MSEKYRVAVIGRTNRGNYGHGLDTVWPAVDRAELVAVADEDEKGLKEATERLGVKAGYSDYREMLRQERPQIVSVAPRWLDCHHDMVLACAEYGASIFLEKPMCRTLAEADAMVEACERSHVKLAIAHQTRYSPKIQVIKDLIAGGRLGRVLEFCGRGKEDRRGGGEDLWVLGTHIFDLMRIFGGNALWCYARVTQDGRPVTRADVVDGAEGIGALAGDRVEAMYGMENGAGAYFSSHRNAAGRPTRFGLTIRGSKGLLETYTGSVPDVHLLEDSAWSPGRTGSKWIGVSTAGVGKPEPLEKGRAHQGNIWICEDLIQAIEEDRDPIGSVYEARGATEMIVAAFESHRQGGPVKLPLENRENPLLSL